MRTFQRAQASTAKVWRWDVSSCCLSSLKCKLTNSATMRAVLLALTLVTVAAAAGESARSGGTRPLILPMRLVMHLRSSAL